MSTITRTATRLGTVLVVLALVPGASWAQPTLDTLWPNDDGTKWTYDFAGWDLAWGYFGYPVPRPDATWDGEATLTLAGTTVTAGGTAQNLVGWHSEAAPVKPGLALASRDRNVWRARPDLRAAIAAKAQRQPASVSAQSWVPLLLHDGFFMKLTDRIEMWQEGWDHSTWTYLTDALGVGQMFSHQLVPELADNVWLYGTVASNTAMVTVPAGTFANAVRIDYVIDYGESEIVDPTGQTVIGTTHPQTTGWVTYVPEVGPVDMQEEYFPFRQVDCGTSSCPSEITDHVDEAALHLTLQLTSGPVAVEGRPWGAVKQLYR